MTDEKRFRVLLEAARHFVRLAKTEEFVENVEEIIDADFQLPPEVFAQILMNELTPFDGLNDNRKSYFFKVAMHMGPGFIKQLQKNVAFMVRMDEFH